MSWGSFLASMVRPLARAQFQGTGFGSLVNWIYCKSSGKSSPTSFHVLLCSDRNCMGVPWSCSCAQSWRGRVMERDLGEGLILWWNILWISVDYLLFSISHICWPGLTMFIFQVDFSIPGLTCPETSIAFDTDFEWRERGDVEHFGITNRC